MSVVFVEKGEIDVVDGAFVVVDQQGFRVRPVLTHIPVGGVACIMLEPGTRVSHMAAALAARVGTLLVWVGEAGVRLYSSASSLMAPPSVSSFRRGIDRRIAFDAGGAFSGAAEAGRWRMLSRSAPVRAGFSPLAPCQGRSESQPGFAIVRCGYRTQGRPGLASKA